MFTTTCVAECSHRSLYLKHAKCRCNNFKIIAARADTCLLCIAYTRRLALISCLEFSLDMDLHCVTIYARERVIRWYAKHQLSLLLSWNITLIFLYTYMLIFLLVRNVCFSPRYSRSHKTYCAASAEVVCSVCELVCSSASSASPARFRLVAYPRSAVPMIIFLLRALILDLAHTYPMCRLLFLLILFFINDLISFLGIISKPRAPLG